jgi:methionine sulfoxide reductase heme-binding subunit
VVRLWKVRGELSTPALIGLSLTVAALTFAAEAIGIAIAFNAPALAVLEADLDFDGGLDTIRPGWLVLAAGLAVSVLNFVCARVMKPKPRQPRPAPRKDTVREPARAAAG